MADSNAQLTEGVETEAHESSGLPQLESQDWAPQLIWLLLSFVFLYVMMSRVALPKIGSVIEDRRDKIANDLDRAAELKKEADEALQAYEQALSEARNKAHAIAAETRDRVKAETDRVRAESNAKLTTRIAKAEESIMTAREQAMLNVNDVASQAVQEIVAKLIGKTFDDASVAAAVQAELKKSS